MIPNNNLSVLPFYTSIEQQNARRWWVYGRVYPLFCPALSLVPFQIMREPLFYTAGIFVDENVPSTGEEITLAGYGTTVVQCYGTIKVYNIPAAPNVADAVMGIALDEDSHLLGTFNPLLNGSSEKYIGEWVLPEGTQKIEILTCKDGENTGFVFMENNISNQPKYDPSAQLYTRKGVFVQDITTQLVNAGLTLKQLSGLDVIVYAGQLPLFAQFDEGQYYIKFSDGFNVWFSEVFTAVSDIAPYLKITWWDMEDFVMDAGAIVYTNPAFKNVLYLDATIAKPEYPFEEEGETRDGYFFPIKQISEKHYRFKFFASEYLLDVMRIIRMADYAQVEFNGQTYSLDTFLITPEWEDNGDVASVEAEFDTATVAKKVGLGYIKAQRGDFNDDFNNDYSNE